MGKSCSSVVPLLTFAYDRLKELDIAFINSVGKRVNIIPLIAKADTLTDGEKHSFRQKVTRTCIALLMTLVFRF
jgi:septin family protein